jgi:Na+/melibiose symporter-like transporter
LAKEAYAMFLILSALAFTFALSIFVYFFDNFMGASDTADIAVIMAGMHDPTSWLNKPLAEKRHRAAAGS